MLCVAAVFCFNCAVVEISVTNTLDTTRPASCALGVYGSMLQSPPGSPGLEACKVLTVEPQCFTGNMSDLS